MKNTTRTRIIPIQQVPLAGGADDVLSLYQEQIKIYPRAVAGLFSRLRWLMVWVTTDKPFNRTSRSIDLSNRLRTPSEPWISRPCGRFTMKKRRKQNP